MLTIFRRLRRLARMAHETDRRRAWAIAGFLAVASALNYGDRAAISSVLPTLRSEFGLSDPALGLLGSAFLWSYALASPFAGSLADRFSRRRMILASLVAWSAITALIGVAPGLTALIVLRIALGLAECLFMPAAIALTADHHGTGTRAKALSLLMVGNSLGVVLGGAAAGYIADWFGWRAGFWVLGLIGFGLAIGGRKILRDRDAPRGTPDSPGSAVPLREAVLYLMATPSYWMLLLKAMLAGVAVWTFLNWLPLYFREEFGMSLGDSGLAGTLMLQGAALVGVLSGGAISDAVAERNTRRRMLVHAGCYLAAAPFLLAFLTHPPFGVAAAAVAAFSFLRSVGGANEQPILCDVAPAPLRSTAVGIMNTSSAAAGGAGVLTAGLLKVHFGLTAVFGSLSVLFVVAGGALLAGYFWFMPRDIARAAAWKPASR